MLSVRPKVTELAYHVYGRPLHPELFEIHATRTVSRGDYQVKLDITTSGHLITFSRNGCVLTEVTASAQHPLPQRRCLGGGRLIGKHEKQCDYREGIRYSSQFSLEHVPSSLFLQLQEELAQCGTTDGLFHGFDSSGRMAMGGFSFIHPQSRTRSLIIKAFHTFPDDQLVVKSVCSFDLS